MQHGLTTACSAGARAAMPLIAQINSRDPLAMPYGEQRPLFDETGLLHVSAAKRDAESTFRYLLDDAQACEWTEDDVVQLHWRLLLELRDLADPETPLEVKLDTLRWIFTDPEKDAVPFSFANCLRVVGCSPLSPTAYFGAVDVEDVRQWIRGQLKAWLGATLDRYPAWARQLVLANPQWVATQLERNPQWLNEQIKSHQVGDLFM
jgi:hypothetical protein